MRSPNLPDEEEEEEKTLSYKVDRKISDSFREDHHDLEALEIRNNEAWHHSKSYMLPVAAASIFG